MPTSRSLRSGEVEVHFTDAERADIREHAIERLRDMIHSRRKFKYRVTSIPRHEVGLLGEHATAEWIRSLGARVQLIGDVPDGQDQGHGDLMVLMDDQPTGTKPSLVEVKTRRAKGWGKYGHDIDMGQLDHLVVSAVVWCMVPDKLNSGPVRVVGWSPPDELWQRWLQEAQLAGGEDFRANWLDDWPVRPLDELLRQLRRGEDTSPKTTPFD